MIVGFSGNSVSPLNDREYRNNNALSSLTVYLPVDPNSSFITGLNFTTGSNFSGVTFRKYDSTVLTVKVIGDLLVVPNKRYNVVIYWDGVNYVAASKNM